jgi:competence CoiA-like predicted nuclease
MTWRLTFWVLQKFRWLAESMRFLQEFRLLAESMNFALTPERHELDRNRNSNRASRRIKFVSSYCSKNCEFDRNRSSKAGRRSNSLFKQLIARLIWCRWKLIKYDMWIWSILSRNTDWLRLKRVDRQSDSFFVVVCYRLLICAFTDQCWFISTVMIRFNSSILCVYWLRRVRGLDCYLVGGL